MIERKLNQWITLASRVHFWDVTWNEENTPQFSFCVGMFYFVQFKPHIWCNWVWSSCDVGDQPIGECFFFFCFFCPSPPTHLPHCSHRGSLTKWSVLLIPDQDAHSVFLLTYHDLVFQVRHMVMPYMPMLVHPRPWLGYGSHSPWHSGVLWTWVFSFQFVSLPVNITELDFIVAFNVEWNHSLWKKTSSIWCDDVVETGGHFP